MTPKEKAIELVDKFINIVGNNCYNSIFCRDKECIYNNQVVCKVDKNTAKQCAISCVDEILDVINNGIIKTTSPAPNQFWYLSKKHQDESFYIQVKEEINKL